MTGLDLKGFIAVDAMGGVREVLGVFMFDGSSFVATCNPATRRVEFCTDFDELALFMPGDTAAAEAYAATMRAEIAAEEAA